MLSHTTNPRKAQHRDLLRRGVYGLLVLVFAYAGFSAVLPDVGQAAIAHNYLSQITEVPAGAHVAVSGPFREPEGLAFNAGALYVADPAGAVDSVVDKFSSTGGFLLQLAGDPEGNGRSVAVNHATGEIYVGAARTNLVDAFSAAGVLLAQWEGTTSGSFASVSAVAMDNSSSSLSDPAAGDLYVADPVDRVVDVLKPEGSGRERYLTQLTGAGTPSGSFGSPSSVAVDDSDGDVVVADEQAVDVFAPKALGEYTYVEQLTGSPAGGFGTIEGVAVDSSSGDIYVSDGSARVVDEFTAAGEYLGRISGTPSEAFGLPEGIAVGENSDVYVADQRADAVDVFGPNALVPDVALESASGLTAVGATLNGTVDPDDAGPATCRFEYGAGGAFGQTAPCEKTVPNGNAAVAVHADLADLSPDTTYHYRLVASNANGANSGEGREGEFTTEGPGIHEEWASEVGATAATLHADISPHGTSTSYYFEYGGAGAAESAPPPPGIGIGGGANAQRVEQRLEDLLPGTTYHYRVVAQSAGFGEFVGPELAFTTESANGASGSLVGRAWEMVSPPLKEGASFEGITSQGDVVQAAEDGSAITYGASAPIVADPEGSRGPELTQVISKRTPSGWVSADIATPHNEVEELLAGNPSEYKLFSGDLAFGVVEPRGATALSPVAGEASERTFYRRADASCEATPATCFEAVITRADVQGDVPFGSGDGVQFVDASPDLRHIVLSSAAPLIEGAGEGALYEWSEGRLQLVSVLPGGGASASGGLALGENSNDVRHAVSNDGSRVVWRAERHLYLRDLAKDETIQLDTVQGGSGRGEDNPEFETANSEGSRIFFADEEQLTPGSSAGVGTPDLYVCEVVERSGGPACDLVDLTPTQRRGEHANVQGMAIGASEDGSYVYFVATGVLSAGSNSEGEAAVAGADNLYMERFVGGGWLAPTFVATLSGADEPDWGRAIGADLSYVTSRVSPDGRYLAFMSERSLTGYDNDDVNSGAPDEEVFLYDAQTGRLVCASCNPSGARPEGVFDPGEVPGLAVDRALTWSGHWLAGSIPGWTGVDLVHALYQSRYLSDSGRLFFDSADALVPKDVNGLEDVYEYEPQGLGGCDGETEAVSGVDGGCIGLISSGASTEESAFLDASASGGDVFFLTSAELVPQDLDDAYDVYDAHECSGESPCASALAESSTTCTTAESCRGPEVSPPEIVGAPPSATFSGAGSAVPLEPATAKKREKHGVAKKAKKEKKVKGNGKGKRRKRVARRKRKGRAAR